jgi:lipopolysaccharide/colanic/teichoic acid biosynthesis glycosyltransferase
MSIDFATMLGKDFNREIGEELPFPDSAWAGKCDWYQPWKIAVEFVIASILLLITGPIILLSAALIKLTSRGPALYTQTRLGRHGLPYTLYKLRTMHHDCEKETGPCWSTPNDPRVIFVGRFLRWAHIDELPQLWNVLRGEMSLLGPRPERPEFVPFLERAIPYYRARLQARPGITGLAQVQFPPDTDIPSVRRKVIHDLYYIRNTSPWLDLQIVLATVGYVARFPYAITRRLVKLPDAQEIKNAYEGVIARYKTSRTKRMHLVPPQPVMERNRTVLQAAACM